MIVISDDGVRRSSQAFSKRCGPIHLARLSKVAVVPQPTRRLRGIILNDVTNEDAGIEPDHPRPARAAMARSVCSSWLPWPNSYRFSYFRALDHRPAVRFGAIRYPRGRYGSGTGCVADCTPTERRAGVPGRFIRHCPDSSCAGQRRVRWKTCVAMRETGSRTIRGLRLTPRHRVAVSGSAMVATGRMRSDA